jgi:glycosyltransferase involved in cell wall biosynthesis
VTDKLLPMRLVYHHRTAGRGAEGNHIMALVRALEAAGHCISIVSPPGVDPRQTAGHVPLDKGAKTQRGMNRVWQWVSKQAPQILFELLEIGYNFQAIPRLIAALRRERPSAYYERYAFFLFAGVFVARLFRLPVAIEVNEISGIERARKQILTPVARWIERYVFSRANAIFTVSSFLRDEVLRRGGRAGAVHLMPNAIDPRRFELNGARGKVRHDRGLDGAVVAGFVGWFDHWDRLDLLIDAVATLRDSHPELRLMLVGDGPVAPMLREKVHALGIEDRVILTGAVKRDEVSSYIDAMDICVLPDSNPYGSPMVLFEFMALGKAVVAPDIAPIRDVVEDRQTGIIIPRADAACIAATLRDLLADTTLRTRLGAQSREYVLAHRTWSANASRVVQLTQQAMQGRIS